MHSDQLPPPARHERREHGVARARRAALAVVGALIVTVLGGCLDYSADLRVSSSDRVSGTVILTRDSQPIGGGVKVAPTPAPIPMPSGGPNSVTFPQPVSDTDSIVVSPYSDGTKVGYKIEYKRATFEEAAAFRPLGDRGGALVFTRDGDTVTFEATFDLSYSSGTDAQRDLLAKNVTATVTLGLPGTIGDSNGTVTDDGITWTLEPLETNDLSATYTSAAPGAATSTATPAADSAPGKAASASPAPWIAGGAVVLVILAAGAVLGVRRRRHGRRDRGEADDEPTATYAVAQWDRKSAAPSPESASGTPGPSAMITTSPSPGADAPQAGGGWAPPQPKWKQQP